ncbi:MAG: HNH endonuclease [Verrucomicrobiales bacterium]|nr:HNH endonuclease [Verrucomicrobiales bacterium]
MANWTRKELLAALNLYFETPFGKQHSTHPPIVALAEAIGRSPGAIAMKLSNFTNLDPSERARGIKGLSGASKADRAIWNEFEENREELVAESEVELETLLPDVNPTPPEEIEDSVKLVKYRRQQRFFRRVVLSSYRQSCCISGNPVPELLRASHITPWAADRKNRLNPSNGLCLAATYDTAFDRGLISFNSNFELMLSNRLGEYSSHPEIQSVFEKYRGVSLQLPEKNLPDATLLAWHTKNVFVG